LKSLGAFAGIMENMSLFEEVAEIVQSALGGVDEADDEDPEDKMDVDDKAGKEVTLIKRTIYHHSIEALAQAFRPKFDDSDQNLLKAFGYVEKPPKFLPMIYESKLVQASAMEILTSKLTSSPKEIILLRMWEFIVPLASDRGSEELRTMVIKGGVSKVAKLVGALGEGNELKSRMSRDLEMLAGEERVLGLKGLLEDTIKEL